MGYYSANAIGVYLDDTVTGNPVPALVAAGADFFLIRAVAAGRDAKNNLNYDLYTSPGADRLEAERLDIRYRFFYDEIRKYPDKPIFAVIEANPATDLQDYVNGKGQIQAVKDAFGGMGDPFLYRPDALAVKITDFGWIQNGHWVDCTPVNFRTCYENFFPKLFATFGKSTFGWTKSSWWSNPAATNMIGRLDTWNTPQPQYPFIFTYYPAGFPAGATAANLHGLADALAVPNNADFRANLALGSHTAFKVDNNLGLWGFDQSNFVAGLTGAGNQPKKAEVFIFAGDVAALDAYLPFAPKTTTPPPPPPPPPDTVRPSTPASVTAYFSANQTVVVTWSAATDNVGVIGYNIYAGQEKRGQAATLTFTDTGLLMPASTYTYTVEAFDSAGNVSLRSLGADVIIPKGPADTTPPAIPTGLIAKVQDGAVLLGWQPVNDADLAGYTIRRNDGALAPTQNPDALDDTVHPGQTYTYTVESYDKSGNHSAPSAAVTVTVPVPPTPTDPDQLNRIEAKLDKIYALLIAHFTIPGGQG